jgi:Domain of unknown function (DUF6431)
MSQRRLPPPEPAPCLVRPYPSSQKGGTLIAEQVTDRDEHRRRLCTPDGYRPAECPRCHHRVLHVHDYLDRVLLADSIEAKVGIVRYICAGCGGVWRILPAFVARHLWRSWDTVEANTLSAPAPPTQPRVPERTLQRWRERLMASAMVLVQLFAASLDALLVGIACGVGHDGTREELVRAYAADAAEGLGNPLALVAGLVHRLMPGVRLM